MIFHVQGPTDYMEVRNSPNTLLETGLQARYWITVCHRLVGTIPWYVSPVRRIYFTQQESQVRKYVLCIKLAQVAVLILYLACRPVSKRVLGGFLTST